jgi:hypothetical protein
MDVCPHCQKRYPGTSIYGNLYEAWEKKEIPTFKCEMCDTYFKATKPCGEIEDIYEAEWEKI